MTGSKNLHRACEQLIGVSRRLLWVDSVEKVGLAKALEY